MKSQLFIFLLVLSSTAVCLEPESVVERLGLAVSDFEYIWNHDYCGEDQSITLKKEQIHDKDLLGFRGIAANFWVTQEVDEDQLKLIQGPVCKELYGYVYQNKEDVKLNPDFLKADQKIKSKYGYSSIILLYVKKYTYFSMNGEPGELSEYQRKLVDLGLFSTSESPASFNGRPSIAIQGFLTEKGKALRSLLLEK